MATAGYNTIVQVSTGTAGGPYTEILGVNSVSLNNDVDLLDVTQFTSSLVTGGAAPTKLRGLQSGTIEVSGDWLNGDTGQDALHDNSLTSADTWIRVLFDGTNGYEAQVHPHPRQISSSTDGKVEFSCSCEIVNTDPTSSLS